MIDFNKYIGVPFLEHGRDLKTGVDCFGLCKAILKEEFGRDLPEWIPGVGIVKYDEQWKDFRPVSVPEVGSIGVFSFAGVQAHVGLYIGEERIIHVMPGETAVAEKIEGKRLKGRLNGWYDPR